MFVAYMTNGLGFIAIVIAMLARGRAGWIRQIARVRTVPLGGHGATRWSAWNIPTDVVYMLPFLAVMAALVLFARRAYLPAALGVPYGRGRRWRLACMQT